MSKKIAVVVRGRQSEALRMAVGIILMDDTIDVYVLDCIIEKNEQHDLYLETFELMEMNAYSNMAENETMQRLSIAEIAVRLPFYDHVLAY